MTNKHYDQWLQTAMEHGISPHEASRMPQAQAAHEADRAADRDVMKSAKKGDFLAAFAANRAKGGSKGFEDQEEMLAAMSDPAYETSQEYRDAVAEILKSTPAEVIGVSATAKSSDGTFYELGRQPQSDKATVGSMMENAYRDMIIDEMGKLDLGTPKGRFEYMKMLNDPANAEAIAYMEGLVTSDDQRTNKEMLGQGVQRYVVPVTGAIDVPEGVTVYEEGNGAKS